MERHVYPTHNEHAVEYRNPVIVNPPVIGPVVTAPPIAGAPVVISPGLAPQPWQFPLQHAGYPTYYEVPMTMPYPMRGGGEDDEYEYEYRFFPPVPGPFYGGYPRPFYGPYPRPFYGPGPFMPLPPFFI